MLARLGRYTLVRSLAQGGMAEVFHARTEGPGGFEKDVALKRILSQLQDAEGAEGFAELFMDEARIAARLTHPNVVQVFDFGEAEGSYYLAMELLDGVDLSAVLRATRKAGVPVPLDVAVHCIAEAAAGLHYAHTLTDHDGTPLRLVHRDVSPSNLFLTRHGEVKVLDFGIAKAEGQLHVTNAGTLKGKHAYVPPEQIHGYELTAQADIWALGVTLYELVSGVRFFQRLNPLATLRAILEEDLPPPSGARPDVPAALDAIVRRAVARDLEERYTSCAELRADLQDLLGTAAGRDMVASFVRYIDDLESGKSVPPPRSASLAGAVTPAPVLTPPPLTPPPLTPPPGDISSQSLERGVRGTLDQLSIPDVVQMIEMGKRSAVVDVWPDGEAPGRLELERGNVLYAAAGSLVGEEAFFALCGAKQGSFHLVYTSPSGVTNVSSPTSFLVLEAMRRIDEAGSAYVPDDGPSLDLDVDLGTTVDQDAPFSLPPDVSSLAAPFAAPKDSDVAALFLDAAPAPAEVPPPSPFVTDPSFRTPAPPPPDAPAATAAPSPAPAPAALSTADVIMQHLEEPKPAPTLKALLARTGALPVPVVILVLRDVLRAVGASFGDGRVAPATVLLEGGRVALGSEHDDDDDARRAAAESPEEASSQSLDVRSRLFSSATLAFEMLTGEAPFLRESASATRAAVASGWRPLVLERAAAAPVRLVQLLEHLWRPAPTDRPQTAAEALALLEPLAARVEELYPNALARLLADPVETTRALAVEQSHKDVELASALAQGTGNDRRRAGFLLLRAKAACPEDGRAGARVLRMAQEEGWFLAGPPSSALTKLTDALVDAPYDLELLTSLRREASDEGRFLHVAAALVRLSLLCPHDDEIASALSALTGDPGGPFGLADEGSRPNTLATSAPSAPQALPERPSLPPVAPLSPAARRTPTPTPLPATLTLPPTPFDATPSTAAHALAEVEELALQDDEPEAQPPSRRVAALLGVVLAVALAAGSYLVWQGPDGESADARYAAAGVAPAPLAPAGPSAAERQRAALDEATALLFDGEARTAVIALAAVVALDPESGIAIDARFALAQAHLRAGDAEAAAAVYREVIARTEPSDDRHDRAQRLLEGLPSP